MKVVVDRKSDPRNVQLFANIKTSQVGGIAPSGTGSLLPWLQNKPVEGGGVRCKFCDGRIDAVYREIPLPAGKTRKDFLFLRCDCGAVATEKGGNIYNWHRNLAQAGEALGL